MLVYCVPIRKAKVKRSLLASSARTDEQADLGVCRGPYPLPRLYENTSHLAKPPKLVMSINDRFQEQRAVPRKHSPAQQLTALHVRPRETDAVSMKAAVEQLLSDSESDSGETNQTIKPLKSMNIAAMPVNALPSTRYQSQAAFSLDQLNVPGPGKVNKVAEDLQQLSAKISRRTSSEEAASLPGLTQSSRPSQSLHEPGRGSILRPSFFHSEASEADTQSHGTPPFTRRKRIRPSGDSQTNDSPVFAGLLRELSQKQIELEHAQHINSMLVKNLRSMQQRVTRLESLSSDTY